MKDRKMKGLSPQPERVVEFDSIINMSDANYTKCTNSDWFIMDGGKARLKTAAELKVRDDKVIKDSAKAELKQTRDEALQACTVEVNGNVFQTRPSDEANFRLRIAGLEAGAKANWLLENDTSVSATKEELQQVYASGLAKIGGIWDEYILALDAL